MPWCPPRVCPESSLGVITEKEWLYGLTNLGRAALTSRLSPWQCGRNAGCWCLEAGPCEPRKRGGDRGRHRERASRKSSRRGVKEHCVRKLSARNTNVTGWRWTGVHVRTHTRTHAQAHQSVACSQPQCLSQFCQQSVGIKWKIAFEHKCQRSQLWH